jgi:hypothetical protein
LKPIKPKKVKTKLSVGRSFLESRVYEVTKVLVQLELLTPGLGCVAAR